MAEIDYDAAVEMAEIDYHAGMQKLLNQVEHHKGNCWETSVHIFNKLSSDEEFSKQLRFVSLIIPAADTKRLNVHYVVQMGGIVVDGTAQHLDENSNAVQGMIMPVPVYIKSLHDAAEYFGIEKYKCQAIMLSEKQFRLLHPSIVGLVQLISKKENTSCSHDTIRECMAALVDVGEDPDEESIVTNVLEIVFKKSFLIEPKGWLKGDMKVDITVGKAKESEG